MALNTWSPHIMIKSSKYNHLFTKYTVLFILGKFFFFLNACQEQSPQFMTAKKEKLNKRDSVAM